MARKIGIIPIGGTEPDTYVKKSVAHLLVRRLLAKWDGPHVRYLLINPAKAICAMSNSHPAKPYIPEKMPPREIPGVYFKPAERKPISLQTAAQCLNAR